MNIWAKGIKGKEEELQEQPYSLWVNPTEKEKEKTKGSRPTHINK